MPPRVAENAPAVRQEVLQSLAQKLPIDIENPREMNAPGFRTTDAAGPLLATQQSAVKSVEESVHPQSVQIVQQQLQTLDTRQILWQGQIWPGQEMRWEIDEDASRREEGREEETGWHTTLNLQLPSLGGVSARLAFAGGAFHLDIAAESPASVDRMRSAQTVLAERFEASGLQLSGVAIRHHGE
jgi:hypothetical protein